MKNRITRKERKTAELEQRLENAERAIVAVLLRLEKMEGVEEKKDSE